MIVKENSRSKLAIIAANQTDYEDQQDQSITEQETNLDDKTISTEFTEFEKFN